MSGKWSAQLVDFTEDLLAGPASQADTENTFFLRGRITAGHSNRLTKIRK
jgi:hypothetical protein